MFLFVLILAIDTSTRTGSIALLRDGGLLAEVFSQEETPYSMRLFRDLEVLKAKAEIELSQIDLFAVTSGPGSFTGLRIGLTAVKAWAEVYGKPIAAISALEAISSQSKAAEDEQNQESRILAPFFDARRGQIFGAIYRRGTGTIPALELAGEESILTPSEFIELVKGSSHSGEPRLVSPVPGLLPPSLVEELIPGAAIEAVSPVLAPVIGRLGFERARRGELVDPLRLDANYVRRSDAEAKWRDG